MVEDELREKGGEALLHERHVERRARAVARWPVLEHDLLAAPQRRATAGGLCHRVPRPSSLRLILLHDLISSYS